MFFKFEMYIYRFTPLRYMDKNRYDWAYVYLLHIIANVKYLIARTSSGKNNGANTIISTECFTVYTLNN